jgi:hypothetical protein
MLVRTQVPTSVPKPHSLVACMHVCITCLNVRMTSHGAPAVATGVRCEQLTAETLATHSHNRPHSKSPAWVCAWLMACPCLLPQMPGDGSSSARTASCWWSLSMQALMVGHGQEAAAPACSTKHRGCRHEARHAPKPLLFYSLQVSINQSTA